MRKWILSLVVFPAMTFAQPDLTDLDPHAAGKALAEYAETYHEGWQDVRSEQRLVLRDAAGQETEKPLVTYGLAAIDGGENEDEGRSIIVFDRAGTALLTHMRKFKPDVQWVYTPGLKRKMRIQASNLTSSFIGSEFTFEDLRSQYVDKFSYELLREENYDDMPCWVLKRVSEFAASGYSHQEAWMDQAEYRIVKVVFYDRNGELLKTLTTHGWTKQDDRWWRAGKTTVVNHQTGRASDMVLDKLLFYQGYSEGDFQPGRKLLR